MIRRKKERNTKKTDICLFLEGTYPYIPGGVSTWTHELIKQQSHLTFHIVALLAPDTKPKLNYELPANVIQLSNINLQNLPDGSSSFSVHEIEDFFHTLEKPLSDLQKSSAKLSDLKKVMKLFSDLKKEPGEKLLLDSEYAWKMLRNMYDANMSESAFIDYFWSWRALLGGFYSIILADIPEAEVYHALCTGYAGLFLARAKIETNKPCILTEHGIYTNERRIEIASATWLFDQRSFSLAVGKTGTKRELKDFWTDTFEGYSKLCYDACDQIITLYKGNQSFQLMDGANPAKMCIIPNGIDFEKFSAITPNTNHAPTIALIGRIVPIKDVKTFIRAAGILRETIPGLIAFTMGSTDEDEGYYNECRELVEHYGLNDTVIFTGKVDISEYLKKIDVVVLTSISEAQPLVILEAGAAGIPCVATDVGACREMILGMEKETPKLGPGGAITPLSNPKATAAEILRFLTDKNYYNKLSAAIKERVHKYYNKSDQHKSYKDLYDSLITASKQKTEAA